MALWKGPMPNALFDNYHDVKRGTHFFKYFIHDLHLLISGSAMPHRAVKIPRRKFTRGFQFPVHVFGTGVQKPGG